MSDMQGMALAATIRASYLSLAVLVLAQLDSIA